MCGGSFQINLLPAILTIGCFVTSCLLAFVGEGSGANWLQKSKDSFIGLAIFVVPYMLSGSLCSFPMNLMLYPPSALLFGFAHRKRGTSPRRIAIFLLMSFAMFAGNNVFA